MPVYGSKLIVDPAHTSEICSACEASDAESRVTRDSFVCADCRAMSDADVNAAKNILARGTSSTGGLPGMACGSSQTAGRKQEDDARDGRKLGPSGPRVVTERREYP